MQKKAVLNEIMDVYDENERLKNELKRYTEIHPVECAEVKESDEKAQAFIKLTDKAFTNDK